MDFAFSEEQEMLRAEARRYLEATATSDEVRRLMETDRGFEDQQWAALAELGWPSIAIPEAFGGAGFSFLELAVIFEEMGRTLYGGPFLSTVILGAGVIDRAGSDEQRSELLPSIASGEKRVALAHVEPSGRWDAGGIEMVARREGDELVLDGSKMYVLDGHTAHDLVVVVREEGSTGEDGITLVLVPGDAQGVARRRLETMDMTRKQAEVTLSKVRVPATALIGQPGEGWAPLRRTLQDGVVALAAEQVGGAQRCLEMATEYAKVRVQFGRPIGSFQAVKHKCADMLVQVESAKSASYYASWAASADDAELDLVAPLAKSYCSEAYFFCASENIQVHGGIGFTWEHDAHLYFKRAKSSELLFGSPAFHRQLLADSLGV